MADDVLVRVALRQGVRMVLHEEYENEAGGKQWRQSPTEPVVFAPFGDTQVDPKFLEAWLAQNAESDLVKQGHVKRWPTPQQ